MQVSKFGGASVKNADAVRNISKIVDSLVKPQVIVVSAMGKMTNAFEALVGHYFAGDRDAMITQYKYIRQYHESIVVDLFGTLKEPLLDPVFQLLNDLEVRLEQQPSMHFDFEYDQIVSFGELFSTRIVSAYLGHSGIDNQWVDIRHVLKTDDIYRDATVDWELTSRLMQGTFTFVNAPLYVTQGFLGGTLSNITTTLGREGSDYTAAIIGNALDAENVTVWKDVPGILNADPRIFPDAGKIDSLSYAETIELSYYGAQVIHPKTLKPLQNKQIPLFVKSFVDATLPGTVIGKDGEQDSMPIFILKRNQVFLTLMARDFSFITEDNLSEILALFSRHRVGINLLQTSALNFTACVDNKNDLTPLMDELKKKLVLRYNDNVELLTIRHYSQEVIDEKLEGCTVIDSQVTRKNARFVIKVN
ncbi:aspartate kinase [Marinilabilia rubra]|uniref:Aspartokinase n=2 Tax=Marinilabilia rubra TaxID=2162893 RepID=A0A2U2BEJ2_9BACT|nr:aspartate kinase [Marinilabilia rubra]